MNTQLPIPYPFPAGEGESRTLRDAEIPHSLWGRDLGWGVWICLLIGLLALLPITPIQAQDTRPRPHLGYGIHVGPNTSVSTDYVQQLGMDWVKIYDPGMAALFPRQRVLYRMDLVWPGDWEQFKADVANRVQGLAGLPIDAVEIGNEPNLISEWVRPPNAWEYVQVLRIAYTIAKRINPNLVVVSAGLAPTITTPDRAAISDLEYAREMLENGAGQWMDVFGYHPYGYNEAPEVEPAFNKLNFRRTELIRALMEANGVYKQIWLTEFGWLRDPAEDGISCADNDPAFTGFAWLKVPGTVQADYLVRAFQYADDNYPWAGPMFVWNLNWNQMAWLGMCDHRRWFGLLRLDGSPTIALQRLKNMERRYSDYAPALEVQSSELTAKVAMPCLQRTFVGQFTVKNSGYPVDIKLSIEPANNGSPPYIDIEPAEPGFDRVIRVYVNPTGIKTPGEYPLYINVRGVAKGKRMSQSLTGNIVITNNLTDCRQ